MAIAMPESASGDDRPAADQNQQNLVKFEGKERHAKSSNVA